jgi:excisionase family DNA binding protein
MTNTRYAALQSSAQSSNRLLTLPEVCERLGVSRSTFYDWRQAHKAPTCLILPNTQIRVRESDLEAWVASRMDPA